MAVENRDLKKLGRAELLEVLVEITEERDSLQQQLEEAKKNLDNNSIMLDEAGDIATAALKMTGIFESAQKAADLYIMNIKNLNGRQEEIIKKREAEADARIKAKIEQTDKALAQREAVLKEREDGAQAKIDAMLADAEKTCTAKMTETNRLCTKKLEDTSDEIRVKWDAFNEKINRLLDAHEGIKSLFSAKDIANFASPDGNVEVALEKVKEEVKSQEVPEKVEEVEKPASTPAEASEGKKQTWSSYLDSFNEEEK